MKHFALFTLIFLAFTAILCGCNDRKSSSSAGSSGGAVISPRERLASISNLKQIGCVMLMYSSDYDDNLPASPGLLADYLCETDIFIAPWDKESVAPPYDSVELNKLDHSERLNRLQKLIAPENTSYAWIVPAHVKFTGLKQPNITPFLFEKPWLFPGKTDEIGVLYADGRVITVKIPGVSEMSCHQITEKLTEKLTDMELRTLLLAAADREDFLWKNQYKVEFRLVTRYVDGYERDTFRNHPEYMEYTEMENGKVVTRCYLVDSVPLMTGENIEKASVINDEFSGQLQILLQFNAAGAEKFKQITQAYIGRQLAVVIGGKLYCTPLIHEAIPGGKVVISGNFTRKEVESTVKNLNKKAQSEKKHEKRF